MTAASSVFLLIAVVAATLNWVAVGRGLHTLEYVAKPAATASLMGIAATLDVDRGSTWALLLAALVFCIAGDVFLMLPRDAFVPGLVSFAVAQVLFAVSFSTGETRASRWIVGLAVAVPVAVLLARRFVGALRRAGRNELVAPVVAYVVVISAMAVAAVASGSRLAIAGAVTFMVSDSLIAESRFVRARGWHPVGIMVTYHLALAGLVFSLL